MVWKVLSTSASRELKQVLLCIYKNIFNTPVNPQISEMYVCNGNTSQYTAALDNNEKEKH